MARNRSYHNELIDALKNRPEAEAYLNAALERSKKGDKDSQVILFRALRNVLKGDTSSQFDLI